MTRIGKIGLLVLLWAWGMQGNAQVQEKCWTDELTLNLQAAHPHGLPGAVAPSNKVEDDPEFTYVIPVVFHIMENNGPELAITMEQFASQIDVLNEDYGRYGNGLNTHPSGLDTKIRFCLASIDPNGNPTTGIDTTFYANTLFHDPFVDGQDEAMKELAVWDPLRYMNVYIVRRIGNGQTAGYAYFPGEVAGTALDGLVIDYRQIGRSTGTAQALGRTTTHEVGHYLDLYHPWGLSDTLCGGLNDRCDDTPAIPVQFFATAPNCNAPPAICDPGFRQIENYMDYSDDECLNLFTVCQGTRMRKAILNWRTELVSSSNLALTGCSEELNNAGTLDKFTIFPNPSSDVFMVYVDFDSDVDPVVEMYDFAGRLVRTIEPAGDGRGAVPVDVSTMMQGTYHLIARQGSNYIRRTVVIAR